MSRIPEDRFDNQQDQADNQDRDADQAAQQSQQDELNEALAKIPPQDQPQQR
ncbi:hypothetical protein [Aureimonas ureilytica]|uniref:hypothetical protein n=1 Tax=Aureimonas ureilytica TaxID=401562 RepID=UPI00035CB1D7|nr:hypothetical protein [Aureimonas ureilytica]